MDCFDMRRQEAYNVLENDIQKTIFIDWFEGGRLWERYDDKLHKHIRAIRYAHVNDHDWDNVSSFILETCSMGMG